MLFPGPALNLGHPARPAVTSGLGISAYVFAPIDEIPAHSKPTYPSKEVLDQVYEVYPDRIQPGVPLEVVGEMHLTREEPVLPTAEITWHPKGKPGTLIGRPGSCDQVLGRKGSNPLSRRNSRLPRRR